jgi:SAM-dependent methyltransferase
MPRDLSGLIRTRPEAIASLIFLGPRALDPDQLSGVSERLLLIHGDQGPNARAVPSVLSRLDGAAECVLAGYYDVPWGNAAESHGDSIVQAFESHARRTDEIGSATVLRERDSEGWLEEIWYRVRGQGPALVLFPVEFSAVQWEPLIPQLSQSFTTITLGGERLSPAANLLARAQSPWYQGMLRNLVAVAQPQPGERLLEVGCGSGVALRWLARETREKNHITGVDVNGYLLREARVAVSRENLDHIVTLREGNAEALPLEDESFDVAFSITVLEEGDADRMLAELVRVTRPGGRVACMVRSTDIPWWVQVPVNDDIRSKVQWAGRSLVDEHGCADASLGPRMTAAGLRDVTISPQIATVTAGHQTQTVLDRMQAMLDADEKVAWDSAVAKAQAGGSLMVANTFYCAVGTR